MFRSVLGHLQITRYVLLPEDALRSSWRISRKEIINNVTIRQQIGLEETIVKETEQNQLCPFF
jgi:hypothetical protein